MPAINLRLSGDQSDYDLVKISKELTTLTCEILDKKPEKTMIFINFIPPKYWFINSKSLLEQKQGSFKIDITITDESCTREQKAKYIAEAFKLMSTYIKNLHPHGFVA